MKSAKSSYSKLILRSKYVYKASLNIFPYTTSHFKFMMVLNFFFIPSYQHEWILRLVTFIYLIDIRYIRLISTQFYIGFKQCKALYINRITCHISGLVIVWIVNELMLCNVILPLYVSVYHGLVVELSNASLWLWLERVHVLYIFRTHAACFMYYVHTCTASQFLYT
jgi:hypothetical protein